ncbi:MAG: CopG family transcriptional regulator [Thermaerobacter sp.]|nr:CopG family transcriptional regulator [Thermaerobacter sp.]
MARTRNITLSVPDDLLKRAKWLAVQGDTSVSGLLTSYLERIVEEHDNYAAARVRALARLHAGFPVGVVGNSYAWSREELHERE